MCFCDQQPGFSVDQRFSSCGVSSEVMVVKYAFILESILNLCGSHEGVFLHYKLRLAIWKKIYHNNF